MKDVGTIDFAVYENGKEYLGVAKITLPDMKNKTTTINGAGIPGDVEIPIPGHKEAAEATIEWVTATSAAFKLTEERVHNLDLRIANQQYDEKKSAFKVNGFKVLLSVAPKALTGGQLAPASPRNISGTYSVFSYQVYEGKKCLTDYRPLQNICKDYSGKDRLADVRKALGK